MKNVTTTNDERNLLAAIIQHPEENTPRLAYADLLDEIGGAANRARAQFIRVQIELARRERNGNGFPGTAVELDDQARRLLCDHGDAWVDGIEGGGVAHIEFHRGFVEQVMVSASAFIRRGAGWFRKAPLRGVRLTSARRTVKRLVAAPHFGSLRELVIADDRLEDEDLIALAAARRGEKPCYPNLEALCIEGDLEAITSAGLAALAWCEMPALRRLCLHGTTICDIGAEAVAASDGLGNLEGFSVTDGWVGDDGLAALLRSPRRKTLSILSLAHCDVTAGGLEALADLPRGSSLRLLHLPGNPIDSVDVDLLARVLEKHSQLELNLCDCPIRRRMKQRFGAKVRIGRGG